MPGLYLSKTKYMKGLQCPKLLWIHYHAKDQIPPADLRTQALFDQGHAVGDLAKRLFPDGIDVSRAQNIEDVLGQSGELLANRKPLFEAGFRNDRCYSRIDVLNPVGDDQWDIIEVKSGTRVKAEHYPDVAFQKYCCEGAGLKIRQCFLMHVNDRYVRQGEIDPRQLLTSRGVTDGLAAFTEQVAHEAPGLLGIVDRHDCPEIDIGPHCGSPYECEMKYQCWAHVNAHNDNVFTLTRGGARAWDLYRRGIIRNGDIPGDFDLSDKQRIQVRSERSGTVHVRQSNLKRFLDGLEYPLHFLDFETISPGVPVIDNSRPYQQIPFQYSLHILESPVAEPLHHSWIWDGSGDPREENLRRLRELIRDAGSIIAYNASFEKRCLGEAARAFPFYREWEEGIQTRIVDLYATFRSLDVYHPDQHGSMSMKSVLPALTGRTYDRLSISDGTQASMEYMKVMFGGAGYEEQARVFRDLEIYCAQDTRGMIDILRPIMELVS